MDDQSIKTELLDLERRYWQTMKDKDARAAVGLTDFPCVVAGAQGVAKVDEQPFSSMLTAGNWTIKSFTIGDDAELRMVSDDVAILAYKVHEDLIVDGQPVSMDANDASVWVKRDDQWRCALHTESVRGDPYGRDRKTMAA